MAILDGGNSNINIDGSVTSFIDFGGRDTYTILPSLSADVTITDNNASAINLPAGLDITDALFLANGVQFTVNGNTVTFLGDPTLFTYKFGGTPLDANAGTDLTFAETAAAFGATIPVDGTLNVATVVGPVNEDGTVGGGDTGEGEATLNDVVFIQASDPAFIDMGVGDDRYIISQGSVPYRQERTILDGQGNNIIQLDAGLKIYSTEIQANFLILNLSNGGDVRIASADKFIFITGPTNVEAGTGGLTQTFNEFVTNSLNLEVPGLGADAVTGGKVEVLSGGGTIVTFNFGTRSGDNIIVDMSEVLDQPVEGNIIADGNVIYIGSSEQPNGLINVSLEGTSHTITLAGGIESDHFRFKTNDATSITVLGDLKGQVDSVAIGSPLDTSIVDKIIDVSGLQNYESSSLWSTDGNDTIFGGAGDDRIYGGAGIDVMTGGAGSDTFYFSFPARYGISAPASGDTAETADRVLDFDPAVDALNIDPNGLISLDYRDFVVSGASDTAGTSVGSNVEVSAGGKVTFASADNMLTEKLIAIASDDLDVADFEIAFFEDGGHTYIYGAGESTNNADDDFLIELTGVTGLTTLAGFLS